MRQLILWLLVPALWVGCADTGGAGGVPDAGAPVADAGGVGDAQVPPGGDASGLADTAGPADVPVVPDTAQPPDTAAMPDVPVAPDGSPTPDTYVPPAPGDPEIVAFGSGALLLRGHVVTPSEVFEGEVLIEGAALTCVRPSCADVAAAAGATIVDTHGLIFPGMLDAHNHILFDVFDLSDWSPAKLYDHHDQWPQEDAYKAMKAAYDYLLDSDALGGVNLDCEVLKYGEIKGLLGGATSILGAPKGSPQKCFSSLARSIDGEQNDLPPTARPLPCTAPPSSDHIQTGVGLPSGTGLTGLLDNIAACKTWAYVVHVAEGLPSSAAYNEWTSLVSKGLDIPETTLVHGTALGAPELAHMAEKGMTLVWSPRSNVALYGATTPLDVVMAQEAAGGPRLTVALAPDWSMGGSTNMLDELAFARQIDDAQWGGVISDRRLVEMVTIDAARALAVQDQLGSLEEGKLADLIVISGDVSAPYRALVHARPADVHLVVVNGRPLYGDLPLEPTADVSPCEHIQVCDRNRFLCAAEPGGADKLDQSFGDIVAALTGALEAYDAANGTHFAPLAPVAVCP